MFLQGFRGGEGCALDAAALRALIDPLVVDRDPHAVRIALSDGDAVVHGLDSGSLMFSRASGLAIWDLVVELAIRTGGTILFPGVELVAAITAEAARDELPAELRALCAVVTTGAELARVIERA